LEGIAMHIPEGGLPGRWAGLWYAAAVPFLGVALYRLKRPAPDGRSIKPLLGMMSAAVLVISCLEIPIPGATCSHMAGTAMAAILLGPVYGVLTAGVALILQAVFLGDGGLSTWGANVFSMGVVGSFTGYLTYTALRRLKAPIPVAAFFAGMLGDWAIYATTSFELAAGLAPHGGFLGYFYMVALAFVPTQLPLGILEGFVTAGAVKFLYVRRPELLCRRTDEAVAHGLKGAVKA
jgi:cobalt/nickel transport system permease protein